MACLCVGGASVAPTEKGLSAADSPFFCAGFHFRTSVTKSDRVLNTEKHKSRFSEKNLLSYVCNGAGDGNRTHATSLEGWSSTIELHPRDKCDNDGAEDRT